MVISAIARIYFKAARASPDFDPGVQPSRLVGLKDCWGYAQGVDSKIVLEKVPGVGYKALADVPKTGFTGTVEVIRSDDFQTEAEAKDALVERIASTMVDCPGGQIFANEFLDQARSLCAPLVWKAIDGHKRSFARELRDLFTKKTKLTFVCGGRHYKVGDGGVLRIRNKCFTVLSIAAHQWAEP